MFNDDEQRNDYDYGENHGEYHYSYRDGDEAEPIDAEWNDPEFAARSSKAASPEWVDAASWVSIVLLLGSGALTVVGIVFLILKLNGKDVPAKVIDRIREAAGSSGAKTRAAAGLGAAARAASSAAEAAAEAAKARTRRSSDKYRSETETARPGAAAKKAPDLRGVRKVSAGRKLLAFFGWCLLLGFGAAAGLGILGAVAEVGVLGAVGLRYIAATAALAVGGLGMLVTSRRMKKKENEYRRYLNIIKDAGTISINSVAEIVGDPVKEVLKELDDMVDRGYFGPQAYIDRSRGLLVIDREDMEAHLKREREAAIEREKRRKAAEQQATMNEYEKRLAELRAARDRISDPAMKKKVTHIETVSLSIFRSVEQSPEKKEQIRTFMDYYLPTAAKLFNSYAQFEEQTVEGENIQKAKQNIESIADTLSDAFEKQLDSLFVADAMDVSTDIEVLEAMLRRDGLAGGEGYTMNMPG